MTPLCRSKWPSSTCVAALSDWVPPSTAFGGTTGQGENGNYGVAGEVAKNAGAIGYVSAYYALSQHGIYAASLQNAAGNFEQANGATIEAAAKSNSSIPSQGSAFTSAPRCKAARIGGS